MKETQTELNVQPLNWATSPQSTISTTRWTLFGPPVCVRLRKVSPLWSSKEIEWRATGNVDARLRLPRVVKWYLGPIFPSSYVVFGYVTEMNDREGLGKPSQKIKHLFVFFSNLSHKWHKKYIDLLIPLMNRKLEDCVNRWACTFSSPFTVPYLCYLAEFVLSIVNYFNLVIIFIFMTFNQCCFKRKLYLGHSIELGCQRCLFFLCAFSVFGSKSKSKQPYSVYFDQIQETEYYLSYLFSGGSMKCYPT